MVAGAQTLCPAACISTLVRPHSSQGTEGKQVPAGGRQQSGPRGFRRDGPKCSLPESVGLSCRFGLWTHHSVPVQVLPLGDLGVTWASHAASQDYHFLIYSVSFPQYHRHGLLGVRVKVCL